MSGSRENKELIADLISAYAKAAQGTSNRDPKIANANHDAMHRCYKRLRQTSAGRAAISHLMHDKSPYVRLWSAAHSLAWDREKARQVLLALKDSEGPGSFDAGITLEEYEKGTLSFEY